MNENQIELVQIPVIKHQLQIVGKNVELRIKELNIDNQIATVDTVKGLKDLRAELNKELAEFESQRKFIKSGVLKPYDEFESIYKTEISEKYTKAIDLLKDKIAIVENEIKSEKSNAVSSYFKELCESEKIDFLKFESVIPEINLSTTEKKYKEQVNEYITKVIDDLNLIKSQEFAAEIMAEYKLTLNASKAIKTVTERKENEKIEAARIKAAQTSARQLQCINLGMSFVEITQSYDFDEYIFIKRSDIETATKEDWYNLISSVEQLIKDKKAIEQPIETSVKIESAKPIEAPKVETKEEILTASFQVSGTMSQLRALGAYMKANNITYKNI